MSYTTWRLNYLILWLNLFRILYVQNERADIWGNRYKYKIWVLEPVTVIRMTRAWCLALEHDNEKHRLSRDLEQWITGFWYMTGSTKPIITMFYPTLLRLPHLRYPPCRWFLFCGYRTFPWAGTRQVWSCLAVQPQTLMPA